MACPIPYGECQKFMCPFHLNDTIGQSVPCDHGVHCQDKSCSFRHDVKSKGCEDAFPTSPDETAPSGGKPASRSKPPRTRGAKTRGSRPSPSEKQKPKKSQPIETKKAPKCKEKCPFTKAECAKWECPQHPIPLSQMAATDSQPCKDGVTCQRADCKYSHQPNKPMNCPLSSDRCAKYNCVDHPNDQPLRAFRKACFNGALCYIESCEFDHNPHPSGSPSVLERPSKSSSPSSGETVVSKTMWKTFCAFHPTESKDFEINLVDGEYVVRTSSKSSSQQLRSFTASVSQEMVRMSEKTPDLKRKCQRIYSLKDGFFIFCPSSNEVCIVSRGDPGSKPLSVVAKDLKGRLDLKMTVTCDEEVLKQLRGEKKLNNLFNVPHYIRVKLIEDGISLEGFVKPPWMKTNVKKVEEWIAANSVTRQNGPLETEKAVVLSGNEYKKWCAEHIHWILEIFALIALWCIVHDIISER